MPPLLPGRAWPSSRTVTVSSAGKTFSFTGWKVGWACWSRPPGRLRSADGQAVPLPMSTAGPRSSYAVAAGVGLPDEYFTGQRRRCARGGRPALRRPWPTPASRVFRPNATYFTVVGTAGAWAATDGVALLPGEWLPRAAAAWSRCQRRRFTTTPASLGQLPVPVRLLQAAGRPRRGRPSASPAWVERRALSPTPSRRGTCRTRLGDVGRGQRPVHQVGQADLLEHLPQS